MSDGHTECQQKSDRELYLEYRKLAMDMYDRVQRLHAALEKYGVHDPACFNIYHPDECVCGLDRALEERNGIRGI